MKEVIVAKSAGFCFGVQRAVDTVYNQCGGKNVFTYNAYNAYLCIHGVDRYCRNCAQ